MKSLRWISTLVLAFFVLTTGCSESVIETSNDAESEDDHSHTHDHWEMITLEDSAAISETFTDGAAQFQPSQTPTFEQVGLLIDGELTDDTLQFRVEDSAGVWTDWEHVEITWSEADHHVGRILVDIDAETLELRGAETLDYVAMEFYEEQQADLEYQTRDLSLTPPSSNAGTSELRTYHQAVSPPAMAVRRADWGALHPNKICGLSHNPSRMSIHHTAGPTNDGADPAIRMRGMQAFHINNRGWCDIGYHFVVSQSGVVYKGRKSTLHWGTHVGNENHNNIGIALIGDYRYQHPPNRQIDRTVDIVRWVSQTFSIPLNRNVVKGHGEWPGQTSSCPGANVRSRINEILQRAGQGGSGVPQEPDPEPEPEPSEPVFGNLDHEATTDFAATSDGNGYWLLGGDGGVFTFGNAEFFGSVPGVTEDDHTYYSPFVRIVPTADDDGYWLLARDGAVFTFGAAEFHGSMQSFSPMPEGPFMDLVPMANGKGYWILAADGGVFTFGDAEFHGSIPELDLHSYEPAQAMALTSDEGGYWIATNDGGVFTFGNAEFHGSEGDTDLAEPVVDIVPLANDDGYYLMATDGGVFTFGDTRFHGSVPGLPDDERPLDFVTVVGFDKAPGGSGYWAVGDDGSVSTFGDVDWYGARNQ